MYTCAIACGIWQLTCGSVNVSEIPDCFFAFMKNCLLVVIISHLWDVVIILCFRGAIGGSTLLTLEFLALMELPRWLSIISADMVIPIFGRTVRFNPWYVNFISGSSSCENQWINLDLAGWLLSYLHSFKADWDKYAQGGQTSALKIFSVLSMSVISNDMSSVVWSLIDLASASQYLFYALDESCWDIHFAGSRRNGFAYILCFVASIFVMSLILLGILAALPCPTWSGAFLYCC